MKEKKNSVTDEASNLICKHRKTGKKIKIKKEKITGKEEREHSK